MDEAKRLNALVLAPTHGSWSAMHKSIDEALTADGVDVVWLTGDAEFDATVAAPFHEYLNDADVVIADVTEANPSVMYEMGYARARRKPVLPVVERRVERVPAPLRGRFFFVYDQTKPEELIAYLDRWMERYRAKTPLASLVG